MRTVLWVVGEPGIGKTSVARELLFKPVGSSVLRTVKPHPKWTMCGSTVAAGHYTGQAFDGADSIPYNGAACALEYWRDSLLPDPKYTLTILDGDRLSDAKCMAFFASLAGLRLVCAHLFGSQAEARREVRGSNQNKSWIKGRTTKARNFAFMFNDQDRVVIKTDNLSPSAVADTIRWRIGP